MIEILVNNRQHKHPLDPQPLVRAARHVLEQHGIRQGHINLGVLDDAEIQQLNRQFLDHDYATDVLSFLLQRHEQELEGEIVVSAETAARQAADYGWPYEHELGLYVIHGALHLAGFNDKQDDDIRRMRQAEEEACDWMGFGMPPREAPSDNAGDGGDAS